MTFSDLKRNDLVRLHDGRDAVVHMPVGFLGWETITIMAKTDDGYELLRALPEKLIAGTVTPLKTVAVTVPTMEAIEDALAALH